MATILIETKLDVIEKQRKLVEEALGPDSIYIIMKYTCGYIHILLIYIYYLSKLNIVLVNYNLTLRIF